MHPCHSCRCMTLMPPFGPSVADSALTTRSKHRRHQEHVIPDAYAILATFRRATFQPAVQLSRLCQRVREFVLRDVRAGPVYIDIRRLIERKNTRSTTFTRRVEAMWPALFNQTTWTERPHRADSPGGALLTRPPPPALRCHLCPIRHVCTFRSHLSEVLDSASEDGIWDHHLMSLRDASKSDPSPPNWLRSGEGDKY